MTKREAAELIGISEKTLQRRVAKGVYTCTRIGEGQFAVLNFTFADLGLPEPAPTRSSVAALHPAPPEPAPVEASAPEPEPVRELTDGEKQELSDLEFAAAYKAGYAIDSFGNRIDDSDPLRSLVGRIPPTPPVDYNAGYSVSKLPLAVGTDGEPVTQAGSLNSPMLQRRVANGEFQPQRKTEPTRTELFLEIMDGVRRGYSR